MAWHAVKITSRGYHMTIFFVLTANVVETREKIVLLLNFADMSPLSSDDIGSELNLANSHNHLRFLPTYFWIAHLFHTPVNVIPNFLILEGFANSRFFASGFSTCETSILRSSPGGASSSKKMLDCALLPAL